MGLLDVILGSLGGLNQQPQARGGGGLDDVLGSVLGGGAPGQAGGAGGGLGDVLGSVLGGGAPTQSGGAGGGGLGGMLGGMGPAVLMQIIAAMMANRGGGASMGGGAGSMGGGGLGDLLDQFRRAGFGEQADSWVRQGPNMPISPGDLGSVLGDDVIGGLARHTGMPQGDLLEQLSRMLPQAIDRVTPDGNVPPGGLGEIGDILRRFG